MTYAARTTVSIWQTKADIQDLLSKRGATAFTFADSDSGDAALFGCNMEGRRIQFVLTIPLREDYAVTPTGRRRDRTGQQKEWEQACRARWRSLLLFIRAKLAAVDSGITTFDNEFLAHIMLPQGRTVGDWLQPQIEAAYSQGKPPAALTAGTPQISDC